MDFEQLADHLGLEEKEFIDLVFLYIRTTLSDMDVMESAINGKESEQVAFAAHSIKGASENLGFDDISVIAKSIEQKGRENDLGNSLKECQILRERIEDIKKSVHNRIGECTVQRM